MNWLGNGKAIAIIVLFLSVSALNGQTKANSAQQRMADKADIDKLTAKATEKLKHISYREKLSVLDYRRGDSPYDSVFQTTEYLLPDRTHSTSEQKTGNLPVTKSEEIRIGKDRYWKLNNADWKKSTPTWDPYDFLKPSLQKPDVSKCGSIEVTNNGVQITNTKKCEFIGLEKVGGQNTHVYRITNTQIFKSSRPQNQDVTNLEVKTFWIDKKGRFLKIETVRTSDLAGKTLWKAMTEYEYNPKDVRPIEAPIK